MTELEDGGTGEKVLYLDLVGGVAGDMLLAALIDLGAPFERIRAALDRLELHDVELQLREVHPAGLRAVQLDVRIGGRLADSTTVEGTPTIRTDDEAWSQSRPASSLDSTGASPPEHRHTHGRGHRPWREIRSRLAKAELPASVKALAQEAFRRLADAESKVHGVPLDDVEFHEVGSDDAIADIVGTSVAIDSLNVSRVVASPFPLGRGLSVGAHGPIPIPGPATLEILRGAPIAETNLGSETVTPTGAALVRTLAESFGSIPSMRLDRVGVGAGHKRWPDRPNVVRAILGDSTASADTRSNDSVVVECNLDDMNPEHLEPLTVALFEAGAMDVWSCPAMFKKGRAGVVVSALAIAEEEASVARAFFRHSTTLGVRIWPLERRRLARSIESVQTELGTVRVKRSIRPDAPDYVKPEYDDLRSVAERVGVPIRTVEEAVFRVLWNRR